MWFFLKSVKTSQISNNKKAILLDWNNQQLINCKFYLRRKIKGEIDINICYNNILCKKEGNIILIKMVRFFAVFIISNREYNLKYELTLNSNKNFLTVHYSN